MFARSLAAGLLAIAACSPSASVSDAGSRQDGGPRDGAQPADGGLLTAAQFLAQNLSAACARDRRCYDPALIPSCDEPAGLPLGGTGSVLAYDPKWNQNVDTPLLAAAVARGTITFHADKASQCLDLVATQACGTWESGCEVFEGMVAAGGNCVVNEECVAGTWCFGAKRALCQPGTCAVPAGLNTACGSARCAAGLTCVQSLCVVPAKHDEACNADGSPDPPCDGLLLCAGETAGAPGTCKTYAEMMIVGPGGACDSLLTRVGGVRGPYCQQGLACIDQQAGGSACAAKVGSGQACATGSPGQCPDGEVCATTSGLVTGICKVPAVAGQPCADVPCASGLLCATTCQPRQANGGPCPFAGSGSGFCYSMWCGGYGKCAPPGTDCI